MFFPIGDDQIKGGAYPIFSYCFIIINVFVFLYQTSLDGQQLSIFYHNFSAIPKYIADGHHFGTLLSSMFLHGSVIHLIGNMLFLWVFADNIEATIGNLAFVFFYLAGGVLASLAHVYFNLDSDIPSLGASGAISAILGAYLVMFPKSQVKVLVFLIIILRRITMSAFAFLGIWIAMQIFSTYQSLGNSQSGGGTAWFAHLGGLAFGLLMGFVFKKEANRFTIRV
ncbi:MAG: rhomboid family intramembrane serine protease [Saprospiraceae bacterium]|nr:rhomboid family intramembrane serine protease [Saprospiraceae bacterium]